MTIKNKIIFSLLSVILLGGCRVGKGEETVETGTSQVLNEEEERMETKDNDLKIEEITIGEGSEATIGAKVKVHYTGRLVNGTKFDSSVDRGEPFEFILGMGEVIKGWDQGLLGMRVGGKRILTIPPTLAYGNRAVGEVIPADSTLVFEVELLGVEVDM